MSPTSPYLRNPSPPAMTTRELAPHAGVTPPRFDFDVVDTPALRLLLQLDPLPKLVAVSAPPGYGKSVLLSQLYERLRARGVRCLWVTLDDRDSDLSSLVYRLHAALEKADEAALFPPEPGAPFADRIAASDGVIAQLDSLGGATALFIDNLGFCEDRELAGFLERLVFATRGGVRLVLSSVNEFPIDIARSKLEFGAVELHADDLSFDKTSAALLLRQVGFEAASEGDLDKIVRHTEGWPAALRLLQVLLARELARSAGTTRPDVDRVLQKFGGDHRDIAQVLTRRVLAGFHPALFQFMLEIALVREFSGDLATWMTGEERARGWLDTLIERNVLIFQIDGQRRWFRFHTLLREFLLAEGRERLRDERRRQLLNRAAHWHMDHGDNITAIECALDADATVLAQKLLDRVAHIVAGNRGQMTSLIQWVDRLAAANGVPSLESHAWYVWALADSLQYERARRALDEFDRRVAKSDALQVNEDLRTRVQFIRMVVNVFLDRLDAAHTQSLALSDIDPSADPLTLAAITSIAGIAEIDRGELQAAWRRYEKATAQIARSDSAYGHVWVAVLYACTAIGRARARDAVERLVETRCRVVPDVGEDANLVATLDFVRARALLDLGDEPSARALVQRSLGHAMHHGIIATFEQGISAATAFWTDSAEDPATTKLLDRVASSYSARAPLLLAASKVRRLLQLNRHGEALRLAESIGLDRRHQPDALNAGMHDRGEWMLARLDLEVAQGACQSALERIDLSLKTARLQERQRDQIEMLLVAADAHQRLAQTKAALRHLVMAVALATPGHVIYPFVVRQSLVDQLLSSAGVRRLGLFSEQERLFVEKLQARSNPGAAGDTGASFTGVPTLREIQLLALLDQGLNNEQVADRLSLSVATVKWHLHNVYEKLGVSSRSGAIAKTRAMNLLER